METMQYAPVIIPTLNRVEHLKRCLESLERCKWADKTDVYICLDYPPSDKYYDGWVRNGKYLSQKETNNKFKSFTVYRRKENYLLSGKGNVTTAIKDLPEECKSYIISEDDNEFSPNFLVYINKGLSKFAEDDNVYCICGYNRRIEIPESFNNNHYLANDFVAWGVGYWTKRQMPPKYRSFDYLMSILRDRVQFAILKEKTPESIRDIVTMLKLRKYHGDVLVNVYEALEGKYSIMPVVSKVRNHGNDGTGLHSKRNIENVNKYFTEQQIDGAADFYFGEKTQLQPDGLKTMPFGQQIPIWKKAIKYIIFRIDLFLIRHFEIVPHCRYI